MLTNDQRNSIVGEDVFEFEATIGIGSSIVLVRMSYEYDHSGSYNETIDSVRTYSSLNIMDYLEESTIDDLCILGCKLLIESKQEAF